MCDPAGPGFVGPNKLLSDPRTAAKHSQCINTDSSSHGTTERNCDQNWNMGHCGESQDGAG